MFQDPSNRELGLELRLAFRGFPGHQEVGMHQALALDIVHATVLKIIQMGQAHMNLLAHEDSMRHRVAFHATCRIHSVAKDVKREPLL
jgi:hypothetical protein